MSCRGHNNSGAAALDAGRRQHDMRQRKEQSQSSFKADVRGEIFFVVGCGTRCSGVRLHDAKKREDKTRGSVHCGPRLRAYRRQAQTQTRGLHGDLKISKRPKWKKDYQVPEKRQEAV